MAGTIWSKWFWADWETDPALKLCSFAAQGLWMRCLCIAASHDPIGYVAVAGRPLDSTAIAKMTGGTEPEVDALLTELERNGVFSRDAKGRIYSRRMIRDAKRSAEARKNGKKGGNPTLGKQTDNLEGVKGRDNTPLKGGVKPQEPRAISQNQKDSSSSESESRADLIELVARFGRVAGVAVSPASPNKFADQVTIVAEWTKLELTPDEIEELIQRKVRDDPPGRAKSSLGYFTAFLGEASARKLANGTKPVAKFGESASFKAAARARAESLKNPEVVRREIKLGLLPKDYPIPPDLPNSQAH